MGSVFSGFHKMTQSGSGSGESRPHSNSNRVNSNVRSRPQSGRQEDSRQPALEGVTADAPGVTVGQTAPTRPYSTRAPASRAPSTAASGVLSDSTEPLSHDTALSDLMPLRQTPSSVQTLSARAAVTTAAAACFLEDKAAREEKKRREAEGSESKDPAMDDGAPPFTLQEKEQMQRTGLVLFVGQEPVLPLFAADSEVWGNASELTPNQAVTRQLVSEEAGRRALRYKRGDGSNPSTFVILPVGVSFEGVKWVRNRLNRVLPFKPASLFRRGAAKDSSTASFPAVHNAGRRAAGIAEFLEAEFGLDPTDAVTSAVATTTTRTLVDRHSSFSDGWGMQPSEQDAANAALATRTAEVAALEREVRARTAPTVQTPARPARPPLPAQTRPQPHPHPSTPAPSPDAPSRLDLQQTPRRRMRSAEQPRVPQIAEREAALAAVGLGGYPRPTKKPLSQPLPTKPESRRLCVCGVIFSAHRSRNHGPACHPDLPTCSIPLPSDLFVPGAKPSATRTAAACRLFTQSELTSLAAQAGAALSPLFIPLIYRAVELANVDPDGPPARAAPPFLGAGSSEGNPPLANFRANFDGLAAELAEDFRVRGIRYVRRDDVFYIPGEVQDYLLMPAEEGGDHDTVGACSKNFRGAYAALMAAFSEVIPPRGRDFFRRFRGRDTMLFEQTHCVPRDLANYIRRRAPTRSTGSGDGSNGGGGGGGSGSGGNRGGRGSGSRRGRGGRGRGGRGRGRGGGRGGGGHGSSGGGRSGSGSGSGSQPDTDGSYPSFPEPAEDHAASTHGRSTENARVASRCEHADDDPVLDGRHGKVCIGASDLAELHLSPGGVVVTGTDRAGETAATPQATGGPDSTSSLTGPNTPPAVGCGIPAPTPDCTGLSGVDYDHLGDEPSQSAGGPGGSSPALAEVHQISVPGGAEPTPVESGRGARAERLLSRLETSTDYHHPGVLPSRTRSGATASAVDGSDPSLGRQRC